MGRPTSGSIPAIANLVAPILRGTDQEIADGCHALRLAQGIGINQVPVETRSRHVGEHPHQMRPLGSDIVRYGCDSDACLGGTDRKSTRLNSSHVSESRMPSSA